MVRKDDLEYYKDFLENLKAFGFDNKSNSKTILKIIKV